MVGIKYFKTDFDKLGKEKPQGQAAIPHLANNYVDVKKRVKLPGEDIR
jgi:hypothetical protein